MFDSSVLIVAHPDDDILWLSSVLDKMDSIIFCFNDDPHNPKLGDARKKVIDKYPLPNVSSLDIVEPGSWDKADWDQPVTTDYGVKLEKCQEAAKRYRDTYNKLTSVLRSIVANRKNVFTHNPWGEYGHEEHVLVYRVIKALQAEFHYDLWYSNYCSNRSVNLMGHYISGFVSAYECLPVNLALAQEITEVYKKNGCWTWYEDYQWFDRECLMREKPSSDQAELLNYGHSFPVNYIKIHVQRKKQRPHRVVRIAAKITRYLERLFPPSRM